MKTNAFSLAFIVLTVGLFLVSCTKESVQLPEIFDAPLLNMVHSDCVSDCIYANSGDAFAHSSSESYQNGAAVTIKYHNTLTHMVYEFSSGDNIACIKLDNVNGNQISIESIAANTLWTYEIPLDSWSACDYRSQTFWVNRNNCSGDGLGQRVIIETSYQLIGECKDECEDDFSAVLDCSGTPKTLTVTFTAENAGNYVIQGGLTNGTTIESTTADAGFQMNANHSGVVNSNANVTRWEGSLDACETVTIVIEYTGGNGVGSWSAKSEVNGAEVTNGYSYAQDCQY